MSSGIIEGIKEQITQAKSDLKDLAKMIDIAQKAGEDVTGLRAKYNNVEAKLKRWEKALA